jgi:hypothetical protein
MIKFSDWPGYVWDCGNSSGLKCFLFRNYF